MDLGEGLRRAVAKLTGATIIDSKTMKEFSKELQKSLISADVDVDLAFELTKRLEDAALKERLPAGVSAKEYVIDMLYKELVKMLGGQAYTPELTPKKILLVGLYGSGKTTTAAKLAKYYQDRGLGSALIACDVSRPAAYEQLETLAKQANVGFYGIKGETDVRKILRGAAKELRGKRVLICDTSGRNALDSELVGELKAINEEFKPDERMLVINADTGQIAGKQTSEFDRAVKLTGVIVTKLDGSGKGGGALSAVNASKTRITFIGTGEKLSALEPYSAEKFVGRLLGMPDIASLVEKVRNAAKEANLKPEEAEAEELNFNTFYAQLKTMGKMGPLKGIASSLGLVDVPKDVMEQSEERLKKYKAIIDSMTPEERNDDKLLNNASRIRRIATGSGVTEPDVRRLISDFNKMKKLFNAFKNDRVVRKKFSGMLS
ncbi:MAG: signal recognition particle receptor subunit alpha [Candidatus Micrarchaeaceae archaeon]